MAISVKDLRELLETFPEDTTLDVRVNGWGIPALVVVLSKNRAGAPLVTEETTIQEVQARARKILAGEEVH